MARAREAHFFSGASHKLITFGIHLDVHRITFAAKSKEKGYSTPEKVTPSVTENTANLSPNESSLANSEVIQNLANLGKASDTALESPLNSNLSALQSPTSPCPKLMSDLIDAVHNSYSDTNAILCLNDIHEIREWIRNAQLTTDTYLKASVDTMRMTIADLGKATFKQDAQDRKPVSDKEF